MTLFPKEYFTEVFQYYSNQSSEAFKRKLSDYFGTQWQTNQANMCGRFVNEDEFELTRKLEVGSANTYRGGRSMMKVCGKITDQDGRALVKLDLINPQAPYTSSSLNIIRILCGLFTIFVLPFIALRAGYKSKTRLKSTFVNFFGLIAA